MRRSDGRDDESACAHCDACKTAGSGGIRLNPVFSQLWRLTKSDSVLSKSKGIDSPRLSSTPTSSNVAARQQGLFAGSFRADIESEGSDRFTPATSRTATCNDDSGSGSSWPLFRRRERFKRPSRRIARWLPVFIYILNDIINGSFTAIPFVMSFAGWIGGLLLLWSMGALNYYCCHLLYRMRRVFPGAVTLGDLAYYITRSGLAMGATFILAYGLMFMTSSQQLSMAGTMFQTAFSGCFDVTLYKPTWMCVIAAVLIPLSQLRTIRMLWPLNTGNVACMFAFCGIAFGTRIYLAADGPGAWLGSNPAVPSKLFPTADDVAVAPLVMEAGQLPPLPDDTKMCMPVGGVMIVTQMLYYQVRECATPSPFAIAIVD